ncbi:IQ motif, EF-hand binding site [Plasmopara halstedii]|uniref:IQ motif, EF-hand binding site n=1 Tax=Plasmopara halstedii TaxID=4781 RepID=A0A0P1A851_PLAHL|nr:IQ motif, EF-hand binding site [Plasmopara halstedii]CEG36858.1 IQ motif, EF-hand binding site [Plasmopara halstedii]|eukprot:XP_024573227.1 IQ motif, EF-hand binding site [Plasmopara halstedii]
MLPPLPLVDNNNDKFCSRKRVNGDSSIESNTLNSQDLTQLSRPSPRTFVRVPTSRTSCKKEGESEQKRSLDLTNISRIPRDFFVVETNAVLFPPDYPPGQYQSTLNKEGQWETIVFPALTPRNRQQVLYLRKTLDRMRATMPQFLQQHSSVGCEIDKTVVSERMRLIIEYTSQESNIYSTCFHELARQIRFICKEQSELLYEIRNGYDAAVARLIDQLSIKNHETDLQQDRFDKLKIECARLEKEKEQLSQHIKVLEDRQNTGLSATAAPEAFWSLDMGSYSDFNDDEEEWRWQRASASVSKRIFSSKHKYSASEKFLAARRVQVAFRRFQAYKEKSRDNSQMKKQAAAKSIQKIYRGFRDRRLAIHHRAIMRTVIRRRKESAAVEVMQANVRAFLLYRRRNDKSKKVFELTGNYEQAPVDTRVLPAIDPLMSEIMALSTTDNNDDKSQAEQAAKNDIKLNSRQTLVHLLSRFRKLASIIIAFNRGITSGTSKAENVDITETIDDAGTCPTSETLVAEYNDEDLNIFQRTVKEAKALLISLDMVLRPTSEGIDKHSVSEDDVNDLVDWNGTASIGWAKDIEQNDSKVDQKTYLVPKFGKRAVLFGAEDALRSQKYEELQLNKTLWHSAKCYLASKNDTDSYLTSTLASHDQAKRLLSLKRFITNMYDMIVTKLKELSKSRLSELLASHCHLALSFSEWRQQQSQLVSRAQCTDQSPSFNMELLTREHFRCRLGLPQLVDTAFINLSETIEFFAAIDPDVKRFQDFMVSERSEEELVFCCLCRYLCTHCLPCDDCPAGSATSTLHRQPMLHSVTAREIIDVPHILELARILFRVNDERSIVESDTSITEVENVVYREYLPTNGLQQFEDIVSSICIDPDSRVTPVSTNEADDFTEKSSQNLEPPCRHPSGSLICGKPIPRPKNNPHVSRSTVLRRQHYHASPRQFTLSAEVKWVFYEEILALLVRFRCEMNQFYFALFCLKELFRLAAASSTTPSKLLDETAFVETLLPLSNGLSERDLRNIFHNVLRQRELRVMMPLRVFTSAALLLMRNGLLSISTYASIRIQRNDSPPQAFLLQQKNEDTKWRDLAHQWQILESSFDAIVDAINDKSLAPHYLQVYKSLMLTSADKTRAEHALQLLQLRKEIYDLFASRSARGRDLDRAYEIYEVFVNERLAHQGVMRIVKGEL